MIMMMKRPLPKSTMRSKPSFTTLAALLLLLPCSTSAAGENTIIQEGARKKPEHEHCPALLTKALDADANGSGGLDRDEYAQFWNTLTGKDDTMALSQSLSGAYDTLLCECHETFGYDESCCDDTATFDDDTPDDNKGPGAKEEEAFESWTEISLAEFETTDFKDEKPGWMYKQYQKEFCKTIVKSAKNEGIEIDYESLVSSGEIETGTNGTTVASDSTATSTITTTTPASDEGGDSNTTSTSTSSTTTTESFWESTNSTTTTKAEEVTIEDPRETTTIATPEIVESSSTSSTLPATTTEPTTTSTTTSTTPTTTTAAATSNEPITITFLGSTNGNVDAETVNLDEVSHAFWKVSLDLLEEMDVVDDSDRRTRRMQRKLILAFARQIAEYFDSVVMDVEDIDCPSGLAYATEGTPCLQFIYTLTPITEGALSDEAVAGQFATSFYDATNIKGTLYDELYDEYPDTEIVGLGSPGKGIEVDEDDPDASIQADTQIVGLGSQEQANTKEVATSGFPVGGIIGVALAAALVVLLVLAVVIKKRRQSRRQELDDSNLSEDMDANEVNADAEWFDGEHDEEHDRQRGMENTPGSSLAALGVASTVATRLSTGDTEVMVVEKQSWTKNEPRV